MYIYVIQLGTKNANKKGKQNAMLLTAFFFFKAVNKGRLYIYTQILWHV